MLIGHQKQLGYLREMSDSGNLPHALLFCGEEKLGKKTAALEFLKNFFGTNLFSHPDFILLEPQTSSSKTTASRGEIQISQIRDLIWRLSLKPFSAPFKAAIIDQAHLMNKEAQNCFLKTLEEPKGDTLIILISEHPGLLLPTIRSRVQDVNFLPVMSKEIEDYLKTKKLPPAEIKLLADLSRGRPAVAIDLASSPGKLVDFKKKVKEITVLLDSDLGKRLSFAKDLSQSDDMVETMNVWLEFFRNRLLSSLGLQKKWVILKKELSLERIKVILKNIQTTMFLTSTTNVNKRLALEVLLMEF